MQSDNSRRPGMVEKEQGYAGNRTRTHEGNEPEHDDGTT